MHPKNEEQLSALKAIAKAWKINIETSLYNPEFVAMIKKAEKRGNYTEVDPKNLKVRRNEMAKTAKQTLKEFQSGKNTLLSADEVVKKLKASR